MSDSTISRVDTMDSEQAFSDANEPTTTTSETSTSESPVIQSTEPIDSGNAITSRHTHPDMVDDEGRDYTPASDITASALTVNRDSEDSQSSGSNTGEDSTNVQESAVEDDTVVEEEFMEPVVQEVVNATKVDFEHSKIEREIFEDEYHTTVQTIVDNQDLGEQSIHRVATLEEIVHDEGKAEDDAALQAYRDKELGDLASQRKINEIVHKSTVAPAVVSERHHYHIHERIQPVIQREINQTTVVHTTRPVHEVFYRPSHFTHQVVLPTISMEQYKQQQREKAEAQKAKAKAKADNNDTEGNH